MRNKKGFLYETDLPSLSFIKHHKWST